MWVFQLVATFFVNPTNEIGTPWFLYTLTIFGAGWIGGEFLASYLDDSLSYGTKLAGVDIGKMRLAFRVIKLYDGGG